MKIVDTEVPVSDLAVSGSPLECVTAALSPRTPEWLAKQAVEGKAYQEILDACVAKPGGHTQKAAPEGVTTRWYTVTTIARSARYGGTRTPVICDSFEYAQRIVLENIFDIFECSYMLAVVEAVAPNRVYGACYNEQYWYVWCGEDTRTGKYVAIETPEAYLNTVGFGIG